MITNILKVVTALVVGWLTGLFLGIAVGVILGLGMSVIFQEIVYSDTTTFASVILALILGSFLGFIAMRILNKAFETEDKGWTGLVLGATISLIVLYFYGVIYAPDPNVFDQRFYRIPIYYGVSVGGQIGSVVYAILAPAAVIRDMARSFAERKRMQREDEEKNELSFYRSKNEK